MTPRNNAFALSFLQMLISDRALKNLRRHRAHDCHVDIAYFHDDSQISTELTRYSDARSVAHLQASIVERVSRPNII